MIDFPYTIVRSPRRATVAITVGPDGTVTLRIPLRLDDRIALDILGRKADWVRGKRERNLERKDVLQPKAYVDGEEFLFLGKPYRLELIAGSRGVVLMGDRLVAGIRAGMNGRERDAAAAKIGAWYRTQAYHHIAERVAFFAERLRVSPRTIRVRKMRSRWGSCSTRGSLNFNSLLILAPPDVVDYVVVHELCHCIQPNHSPRFWALVESVFPDYKERKKWLRVHVAKLVL